MVARKDKYKTWTGDIALKGGETKNINITLKRDGIVYITKKESQAVKRENLNVLRGSGYLTQYLSLGFHGTGSWEEDEMGMGQVAGFNLGLTGYFTFRHNGKINGFKLEYARGMSMEPPPHRTSERNITTNTFAFLFTLHPRAVESYTGSPPRLKPVTGLFLGMGLGIINGILEERVDYKFTSFFVTGRVGYDWKYFYVSGGINFYRELPPGKHPLTLGTEFQTSFGVRLRL